MRINIIGLCSQTYRKKNEVHSFIIHVIIHYYARRQHKTKYNYKSIKQKIKSKSKTTKIKSRN